MIRYTLLVFAILAIIVVAQKNWYRALCYMLPMLAFLERGDMPRQMLGIPGFNPFNILLGTILVGWFFQRKYDGSQWVANEAITRLFKIYMIIILVSTFRALFDLDSLGYAYLVGKGGIPSKGAFLMDKLFNDFKWMIPGMLICVGAQSEERVRLAIIALLWTGAALSLQVISKMMPAFIDGEDLATRALRVLDRDLGYHRVNVAAITASVAWAFIAAKPIFKGPHGTLISLGGFGLCTLAMASTGGRMGMIAWMATAMVFGFYRWRKVLFLVPIFAVLAVLVIPGLQDRLLEGFGGGDASEQSIKQAERREAMGVIDSSGRDRYAITSGRAVVWPIVFRYAMEKPIAGHGRLGMHRAGVVEELHTVHKVTTFGHPHNAYLELFLDTGLIGIVLIGLFYWKVLRTSLKAFVAHEDNVKYIVASIVLAFLLVNLLASLGSQSFYPKQGATLLWIAIGMGFTWLFRKPAEERTTAPGLQHPAQRAQQLKPGTAEN